MEQNKDKPVLPALVDGLGKAAYRLVEPFVSESIYFEAINDILSRGGVTDTGSRLYNEEEPEGEELVCMIATAATAPEAIVSEGCTYLRLTRGEEFEEVRPRRRGRLPCRSCVSTLSTPSASAPAPAQTPPAKTRRPTSRFSEDGSAITRA